MKVAIGAGLRNEEMTNHKMIAHLRAGRTEEPLGKDGLKLDLGNPGVDEDEETEFERY